MKHFVGADLLHWWLIAQATRLLIGVAGVSALVVADVYAINTYVEDFSAATYEDTVLTTADWNIADGELKLFPFVHALKGSYDTPDVASDVTISGDLAFVADFSSGLQILDITDPADPAFVGALDTPGFAIGVAVSGDLAFVADFLSGLQIIDISDPAAPALLGTFNTPGAAWDVAIDGDLAFVADQASGLQIIDISDPSAPALTGSVDTPGFAYEVVVAGNVAFVADEASGLQAIDISDPAAPAIVGNVDTPGLARGLAVAGDHVFVADEASGLQVIDISDPTAPAIVGSIGTPGEAWCVVVDGDRGYVADSVSGLRVIDISAPASPAILANVDTPGDALALAVAGNRAYVADQTAGLQVVEIRRPLSRGSADTPGEARGVAVAGNYTYVADGASGLTIVDITDPSSPAVVGSVDTPGSASAVAVSGDVAFVADEISGLQVIDITDPTSPTIIGSVDTDTALGVVVSGNVAFVADGLSGLLSVDITDPTSPTIVGGIGLPDLAPAWSVAVAGDVALVAADFNGLFVIDITDPTGLSIVGGLGMPGEARDIAIRGDAAFVAARNSGLQVVDISDLTSLGIAGSVDTPSEALGVSATGDMVFVADYVSGLQLIEVTDLAHPTIVGSVDTPHQALASEFAGGVSFVADDASGLQVIEVFQDAFVITADVGRSLPVDTASDVIVRARLSSDQTGRVDWELSADGGRTFGTVTPGAGWTELSPGDDLVWRSTHTYDAEGVNPTASGLTVEWLNEFGPVVSIADVPDDQGRQVRVEWRRSGHDFIGDNFQILEYSLYRRIDGGMARAHPSSDHDGLSRETLAPLGWDYVLTVPADSEDDYAVIAPTLADSTAADGMRWSTFLVRARVAPGVFFDSPPDSGYSVDNLAPGAPGGLMLAGTELSWDQPPEEDFQYHSVYGSAAAEFDPAATLIGYTADQTYDVSGASHDYYHVTTTDHAGNEGEAASVDGTVVSSPEIGIPTVFAMSSSGPNPFRSLASMSLALPVAMDVRLSIYDVNGREVRTLVRGERPAGFHRLVWDARDDFGRAVSSGIYFARIQAGDHEAVQRLTLIR